MDGELLSRLREESVQCEETFRKRFSQAIESRPVKLATKWREALAADPVDLTALSEVREEARLHKADHDVAFFAFSNHIEKVYQKLMASYLRKA